VQKKIQSKKPEIIFLELDEKRVGKIVGNSEPSSTAPPPPPSKLPLTANILRSGVSSMYKSLNENGFESGNEFVVAYDEGLKINSKIVLGDRDVDETMTRVAKAFKSDFRSLFSNTLSGRMNELIAANTNLDTKDVDLKGLVEVMLSPSNVVELMDEFRTSAPNVYQALIGERDAYMADGLKQIGEAYDSRGDNKKHDIVAVVGAAHVNGIVANLKMNGWSVDC